ncbi:biotin transporter BioY [Corynebacterium caspium]|uniref:biotin transporter BioY n=1 Tax=Corynebacterium caspium TaxID=234828 RepID=UPI0003673B97|nr:biotin transporter BioY [Corynebacterium caspium]WKD59111.1 Biotin transporter BioY [Corynebacterium caspium DSM 44850]
MTSKGISRNTISDLSYAAVFAALIIVLAFVAIPVGAAGVPIVLQNAAIILAGLVLGPRRGFYTAGIFFLLGLVLPVLAGGRTILAALAGPTSGYIVGYLISAVVAGFIAYLAPKAGETTRALLLALASIIGLLIQYGCGTVGLILRAGMEVPQALAVQLPFILPDLGKLVVMVLVALALHKAFPQLRQRPKAAAAAFATN